MDGGRFDDLARSLAARGSRRGLLTGLLGAVAGLALPGRAAAATCPPGQLFRPRVGCVCASTGRAPTDGACPCPPGEHRCGEVCTRIPCACLPDVCPPPGVCRDGACCRPRTACEADECGDVDDGCGGTLSCGPCCTPDCAGKQCGDDGCGNSCGTCDVGQRCDGGTCVCDPTLCAGCCHSDGACRPGDQVDACGTGGVACVACDGDEVCGTAGVCCTPDCAGKQCGDDGCGGSCGTCEEGLNCTAEGVCAPPCVGDCTGKHCGDDGCGGSCGGCPSCQQCVSGTCQLLEECSAAGNCRLQQCNPFTNACEFFPVPDNQPCAIDDGICCQGNCRTDLKETEQCPALTSCTSSAACDNGQSCCGGVCIDVVSCPQCETDDDCIPPGYDAACLVASCHAGYCRLDYSQRNGDDCEPSDPKPCQESTGTCSNGVCRANPTGC